jgi:malate/lactate dehydrogenase
MNTHSVCEIDEVELLRAEVSLLQQSVVELEARLAEAQAELAEDDDDAVWGVWPYNWFVTGWEGVKGCLHTSLQTAKREKLKRCNENLRRNATENRLTEPYDGLHLVK